MVDGRSGIAIPGSARVSHVGEAVSGSRTFSKIVSARRRNQHARRDCRTEGEAAARRKSLRRKKERNGEETVT
jgi:hypothetical protein